VRTYEHLKLKTVTKGHRQVFPMLGGVPCLIP
jgi:hypothetical protein